MLPRLSSIVSVPTKVLLGQESVRKLPAVRQRRVDRFVAQGQDELSLKGLRAEGCNGWLQLLVSLFKLVFVCGIAPED